MMNPTELGAHIIDKYKMKVSGNKLYVILSGKTYSFSKKTNLVEEKADFKLQTSSIELNENDTKSITVTFNPKFFEFNMNVSSTNPSVACCMIDNQTTSGILDLHYSSFNGGTLSTPV